MNGAVMTLEDKMHFDFPFFIFFGEKDFTGENAL